MDNQMQPLLSVIVPVYNTEDYLTRCLDSILCQTYKNLEVICINDGSTDCCGRILDLYASRDSRIVVFHQSNRGIYRTRNRGIASCRGQYVTFVDSDDYVRPTMYSTMLTALQETGADMCICQWESNKSKPTEPEGSPYYGVHQSLDFFHRFYLKSSYVNMAVGSLCNKVFRREIIQNARAEFIYPEDQEINDQVYCQNCKVVVIPDSFYFYFNNPNSITHKPWPGNTLQFLDVLNKRCAVFHDRTIIRDTELLYCNMYIEYWMRANAINYEMPERYAGYFRRMRLDLLSKHCGIKFTARMLLFSISPALYTRIVSNRIKK